MLASAIPNEPPASPTEPMGAATDGGRRAGHIAFGQAPLDQVQTAVDHLFGVRLAHGAAFSRLRGIKDLYLFLTGDEQMQGIFQPERAQFARSATRKKPVRG